MGEWAVEGGEWQLGVCSLDPSITIRYFYVQCIWVSSCFKCDDAGIIGYFEYCEEACE